jgi:hypothetical protein
MLHTPILHSLKLLLPALIPSWRFFSEVAPSPRVEYCLWGPTQNMKHVWHEFRPRPEHLSIGRMIARMVWNPVWNEDLFLVSCSERLIENPTQHSIDEIRTRIIRELHKTPKVDHAAQLQFRLVFIHREGEQIVKEIEYESDPFDVEGLRA